MPSSSSSRGCRPGSPSPSRTIAAELARRRLGYGRGPRMRFEQDEVTLVGGVRHGRTLGSPVAIEIGNTEWDRDPDKWQKEMSPRAEDGPDARRRSPSPAPATPTSPACRSTASTTPATCSSGRRRARPRPGSPPAPWPRRCSAELGVRRPQPRRAARRRARRRRAERPGPGDLDRVDASEVRCFDAAAEQAMIDEIKAAAKDGDSLGGVVEVLAYGVPVGLGSHVHWDRKLDAALARGADVHPGGQGRRDRRRLRGRRPAGERGPRPDPLGRRRRAPTGGRRRWPAASRAACPPARCSWPGPR